MNQPSDHWLRGPSSSRISRRLLLKGMLGAGAAVPLASLLAACGGDDDDGESEPTATSSTGSEAEATATDSAEPTATSGDAEPTATSGDDPEPTAMSSEDGAPTEDTSSEAEVPERIVALGFADELLALDVTPVGAGLTYADSWYPHLEALMADVESVGKWFEPNLEAILALEPDLIIAYASQEAELGEQLEAIAAVEYVVFSEKGGAEGVRENIFAVAEALGLQERADARYQEHLQKIEAAKQQIAEAVGDETVAFIRVLAKEYRLVTTEVGYIGPVLYSDLGLTPPPYITDVADPGDTEGNGYVPVSLEIIPEIQADHMFFLSEDEDTLTELTESSLWQTMPAFESGNIYQVNAISWQTTAILANESKIDEVLEALAGDSASSVE